MYKTPDNCVLKRGHFSTFPLMLTNWQKKERKKRKEKVIIPKCVWLTVVLSSSSSSPAQSDKEQLPMTALCWPTWIGYDEEMDEEEFFPPALGCGAANVMQLYQQLKVVAGFCLCWVNCGSILLHSDLFSMLAPKKQWSAVGFIFLSRHRGPSPRSYQAWGP